MCGSGVLFRLQRFQSLDLVLGRWVLGVSAAGHFEFTAQGFGLILVEGP